ncbi:MAG TPA: DUF4111 domain-containing protein, partial [Anaerolineaceae bacterium]
LRQQDLKPWKFPTPYSLHYSEAVRSQFAADLSDGAWRKWNEVTRTDNDLAAHVTLLRANGVCLWGAPIAEVFPEVPREDFLASILSNLAWAKERLVQDPVSGILNASRALAFVSEGKILSKDEGGRWAMDHLPNQQLQVIRSVMAVYSGLYEDMYVTAEQVQAAFDLLTAGIEQQTQTQS